jgi:hypothetical protein
MQKKKKQIYCRFVKGEKDLTSSLLEKETKPANQLTKRIVAGHGNRGEAGMMKI